MISEKKFREVKESLDRYKEECSQAKGRLEQLYETLKKEFNCSDLKSAKKLLRKLRLQQEAEEKEFEKDYEAFRTEQNRNPIEQLEEEDSVAD